MSKKTDYPRLISKLIEVNGAVESEAEKGVIVKHNGNVLYLSCLDAKDDYKTLKRWFSGKKSITPEWKSYKIIANAVGSSIYGPYRAS